MSYCLQLLHFFSFLTLQANKKPLERMLQGLFQFRI